MTQSQYLVRYGSVPEVARFVSESADGIDRGARVVVRTHRGEQLGTVLDRLSVAVTPDLAADFAILRSATADDEQLAAQRSAACEQQFDRWLARIAEWNLSLELIDLEETLDGNKQILYVLTERGPETTNLALQAAAAGLGLIEVQPVSKEGLVSLPSSGGCGTGGCGCH